MHRSCHSEGAIGAIVILSEAIGAIVILREAIGAIVILRERSDRRISGCRLAGKKCSDVSVQEREILRRPKGVCQMKNTIAGLLRMTSETVMVILQAPDG
jgi:hypothetical protein